MNDTTKNDFELSTVPQPRDAVEMIDALLEKFGIPPRLTDIELIRHLYLLLTFWASLSVYVIEPYVPPYRKEPSKKNKDDDDEGGGGRVYAKITTLDNGWKVYDYGNMVCTSPGDNYGTFSTGKYIQAIYAMIKMLQDRGVTEVATEGLDVGRFAAWCACEAASILVNNYRPTEEQAFQRDRIQYVNEVLSWVREEPRP